MSMDAVRENKKSRLLQNLILIAIVIALAVLPLFIARDAEFGGADGLAEEAIGEINTEYEPWFSPIFEPASGEIESLLFALQAAIGAGVIGYGLGYMKGKSNK
jgi:cobalt/nickel transport protein